MKTLLKISTSLLFSLTLLFSCTKDNNTPQDLKGRVLVINQGNYTEHSASLSLYDEERGEISNRVYETANGISIGATIISGVITPDKEAALICNYPDKIIYIDPSTAQDKNKTITEGLASPRGMVITEDYTYVTNWDYTHTVNDQGVWEFTDSYIAIYDNATHTFRGKVAAGTDAEGIFLYGSRLFVAVKEGIAVFNIQGNTIVKTNLITVPGGIGGARYIVADAYQKLWVSFAGKGVAQIDPATLSVLSFTEVPVDSMDGYIAADPGGQNIFTYNTVFNAQYMPESAAVYKVNVKNRSITPIFSGVYFYGIGVSPYTGDIYTAEVSFTSNSLVKVFSPAGEIKKSVTAGVGTSRYIFF